MIILKHLTVERFRLLREIDLHFPQRGSILIQGPNEAGKSVLFESIYFALYGEPLASGKRTLESGHPQGMPLPYYGVALDDLILYGAPNATVTLTLSIGATEMTITRTIERNNGQKVALYVRRLGMPEEVPITHPGAANERIIAELGRMDGEALRNSCFIEQKGLDQLEGLSGSEREKMVHKLLGLEKLTCLVERFKLTEQDEQLLVNAAERLKLAEIQVRIPQLSEQLGQVETALDAVTVSENLAVVEQQQAEIAEQELSLEQVQAKRAELKGRQGRIQQLKKANTVLGEIIDAYDAITEAQRELPELERQITELERREREELPLVEKRVSDLEDLSRSFGTLERMAADLLTAVNTIKRLEQELKLYQEPRDSLQALDEQIAHVQVQVEQVQQTQNELEELRRAGRPQLEARLQRLQRLLERLRALTQARDQHMQRVLNQGLAEENCTQLNKVKKDLQETEQELKLVENEAKQVQQQADSLERRWRQMSLRRQLEEWQRANIMSQGLVDAEQQVLAAHQRQEQLTTAALAARRNVTTQLAIVIVCLVLFIAAGSSAVIQGFLVHSPYIATGLGILALLLAVGAGVGWQNYSKTREQEQLADRQMQEAIGQVSMMVAAREEAASRMSTRQEAITQIEHKIRALNGNIPRSRDEAQQLIEQIPAPHSPERPQGDAPTMIRDQGGVESVVEIQQETHSPGRPQGDAPTMIQDQGGAESVVEIQQEMNEKRNRVAVARNQVNVTMEKVTALRDRIRILEEQRVSKGWDDIDASLRSDQETIGQLQQEVARLFGQEGLTIPNFASPSSPSRVDPALQALVQDTIKATEHEIGVLDGKVDGISELVAQIKSQQEVLDALLARKKTLTERYDRFRASNPSQQLERAREQQAALRSALQSLQDSLRQRVKPLGVAFGQAAISSAEAVARKQLELLNITLGSRVELENRRAAYTSTLKERQDSLSGYYQQLSKLSSSVGSWVVPLNPFTEALTTLRVRCQREIKLANEAAILQQLETLQMQEGACKAKIELCNQEIEEAYERIATMLAQRSRPLAKSYTFTDIVAVWPLVEKYSSQDRTRLQEQRQKLEEDLHQLEQQELILSDQLQMGGTILDLEQARLRMEQQERSYYTKKHGNLLIKAVADRLMQKMIPRTEYYMQQILPLLTSGHYHDVQITTEVAEGTVSGGSFQLHVWDPIAREYVRKSALSSGAADQLSLALRLAFAIAALPRELGAAPGFLLLDEPLSSFDFKRTQALVDVVTGDLLGQHFEQILFVSHSSTFDPAQFPYHVYMESGVILESNLPVVPTFPPQGTNSTLEEKLPVTVKADAFQPC